MRHRVPSHFNWSLKLNPGTETGKWPLWVDGATICCSILARGGIFLSSTRSPGRLWGPNQPPSGKRWKREVHQSYVVTRLRIPYVLCTLMGLMKITLPAYTAIISLPEVAVFFVYNFSLPLFAPIFICIYFSFTCTVPWCKYLFKLVTGIIL